MPRQTAAAERRRAGGQAASRRAGAAPKSRSEIVVQLNSTAGMGAWWQRPVSGGRRRQAWPGGRTHAGKLASPAGAASQAQDEAARGSSGSQKALKRLSSEALKRGSLTSLTEGGPHADGDGHHKGGVGQVGEEHQGGPGDVVGVVGAHLGGKKGGKEGETGREAWKEGGRRRRNQL